MGISQADFDRMRARLNAHQDPAVLGTLLCVGCDSEKKLHEDILAECRLRGWIVIHSRMDRPSLTAIGSPDFVIAADQGRTFYIEAKTAKGKLTVDQTAWLAWATRLGHEAGVVRSLEDFRTITAT